MCFMGGFDTIFWRVLHLITYFVSKILKLELAFLRHLRKTTIRISSEFKKKGIKAINIYNLQLSMPS